MDYGIAHALMTNSMNAGQLGGNSRMPPWELVERRLRRSMDCVLDHDFRLLEFGPSERAVAHRLAVYLEQEFPDWNVDCEYNRQGGDGDRKQVTLKPSGFPTDVDPDIIVHQRGMQGPNLLAVEVKPASASSTKKDKDRRKLCAYLVEHGYAYAVFVVYGTGNRAGKYQLEQMQ